MASLLESNGDHQLQLGPSLTRRLDETSPGPSAATYLSTHHIAPRNSPSSLTWPHMPLHMLSASRMARPSIRWYSSNSRQSSEDDSDQHLSKSLGDVLEKLKPARPSQTEANPPQVDETGRPPNSQGIGVRRLRFRPQSRHQAYPLALSSETAWKSLVSRTAEDNASIAVNDTAGGMSLADTDGCKALTHVNSSGEARMVDVGPKTASRRVAIAYAEVTFGNESTFPLVAEDRNKKGDVLSVARVAGIMASKRTSDLIPLCHPINITKVDVDLRLMKPGARRDAYAPATQHGSVIILAHVECTGQTGVEMEAMTAAMGAALTIYDMCKATDREMKISHAKLLYKSGGKSGLYVDQKWFAAIGKQYFVQRGLEVPDTNS